MADAFGDRASADNPIGAGHADFLFVDDPAEAILPADVDVRDLGRIGDRFGHRSQGSGVRNTPVRSMSVVVALVLSQGVEWVVWFQILAMVGRLITRCRLGPAADASRSAGPHAGVART